MRHLVAWLPAFRLERCGHGADTLAALIDEVKGATRIVASTPAAAGCGLVPGVTASEARGRVPDVVLVPLDAAAERQDRTALLRALEALSDRVSFGWEDAVVAEISATSAVFGGERATAEQALALLASFGHEARVAVADDPLGALAVATTSDAPLRILSPGAPLGEVPLGALRPSPSLAEAFAVVGLRTCAALAGLDAASVVGRYGADGARLRRVARGERVGLGVATDLTTPDAVRVSTPLPGATTRGELMFVLPGLLGLLCRRLADHDRAVVRLRVVLVLDGGSRRIVSVRVGRPTRSVPRLERAIRTRIDTLIADPGGDAPPVPIDELRLEVEESAPETGWQPGLTERAEHREPLPDLLSRLGDQLGEGAVFRPVLVDRWRPETCWRREAFPAPALVTRPPAPLDDPVVAQESREQALPVPRPSLLLPRPERLEVETDGHGPARVRLPVSTAGREGPAWEGVRRRAGPERLFGEWWAPGALEREYWAVDLGGRTAWIFRDPGGWSLHGWFD